MTAEPRSARVFMRRAVAIAGLFICSALYFLVGSSLSLELTDEGMLVYPVWRASLGDIPYRDFQHAYGPSLFLLNGWLLRLFGADLLVIRWSLVVVKAVTATLVYVLSRRAGSRLPAVVVWLVFVAVWGTPVWVFNAPYASHYGFLFSLAALLVFLARPTDSGSRVVLAGVCFGVATTFKQTLGAFFVVAFVLARMFERQHTPSAGAAFRDGPTLLSNVARVVNILALVGALGLYVGYMHSNLGTWSSLLLIGPAAAGVLLLGFREIRRDGSEAAREAGFKEMLLFGAGVSLPLLGWASFYAGHGLLGALVFNTMWGLPQRIDWFVPLPVPKLRTAVLGVLLASCFGVVRCWSTGGTRKLRSGTGAIWASGFVLSAAIAIRGLAEDGAVTRYFADGGWTVDMARLLWWVPLLAVWASFATVFRRHPAGERGNASEVAVYWFFAAGAPLLLYPAADLPHAAMILPACLPLLAHYMHRFGRAPDAQVGAPSRARAYLPACLVGAVAVAVVVPLAQVLATTARSRPRQPRGFERASGIWQPGEKFGEATALVEFLRAEALDPEGLLVIANEQLLYFLSGVNSPLEREEVVCYLIGVGIISAGDARALIDEGAVIDRLETKRPLIVDYPSGPFGRRFRETLPAVAEYIEDNYRSAETFGGYQVLRWVGQSSNAGGLAPRPAAAPVGLRRLTGLGRRRSSDAG